MKHRRLAEAAQAAMKVATGAMKKQAAYGCQHGVTKITMECRHRARLDSAEKTVPHNQIVAFPQFRDERPERTEVITVISIAHDYVLAARGRDTTRQSVAVTFELNIDDASALLRCNFLRPVGTAVIGNDDFAHDIVFLERSFCLLNADR